MASSTTYRSAYWVPPPKETTNLPPEEFASLPVSENDTVGASTTYRSAYWIPPSESTENENGEVDANLKLQQNPAGENILPNLIQQLENGRYKFGKSTNDKKGGMCIPTIVDTSKNRAPFEWFLIMY